MKFKVRPRIVTWLATAVLFFSVLFIIRFVLSLQMPELPTSVPRWYFPFTGALWASLGILVSMSLFRRISWAPKLLNWASVGFVVWYWIDRLVFTRSEYGRSIWPAAMVLSFISLSVIFFSQRRIDVRVFFQEKLDE